MATDRAPLLAEAARLGMAAGQMAGTWCHDGNTTREWYVSMLALDEDGDPAFWDALPSDPLSGEWADSMTPSSLMIALGADNRPDTAATDALVDDLCDAYELAWYDALRDEVLRACAYQVNDRG